MQYSTPDINTMNEAQKIRRQWKVLEKSTHYLGFNKS